jgi:YD repeat-containing protein
MNWSGAVSRSYDNNFWLTALAVNGTAIGYEYDNDGLLTRAGDRALSRHPQNGLSTGTTLWSVSASRTYNTFGELASETVTVGGTTRAIVAYTRDKLGRITEKTETI